MLRISAHDHDSQTIVSIAGSLEEKHLAELEARCTAGRGTLVLELSELRSADEEAIRWLCGHVERGVRVAGASPYLSLRLERGLESCQTPRSDKQATEENKKTKTSFQR